MAYSKTRFASDPSYAGKVRTQKAFWARGHWANRTPAQKARKYAVRAGRKALSKIRELRPLGLPPLSAVMAVPSVVLRLSRAKRLTAAERDLRRRLKNQRKNAKRAGAKSSIKPADIEFLMKAQCGRCFYCCKKLRPGWHIDHFEPLARGGAHDRRNLRLACAPCNIAKSDRPATEFLGLLVA